MKYHISEGVAKTRRLAEIFPFMLICCRLITLKQRFPFTLLLIIQALFYFPLKLNETNEQKLLIFKRGVLIQSFKPLW